MLVSVVVVGTDEVVVDSITVVLVAGAELIDVDNSVVVVLDVVAGVVEVDVEELSAAVVLV